MTLVSIFPHIKEVKKGETIAFHELFEAMKSDHWKDKIDPLHKMVADGKSDEELGEAKQRIPYFTGSGTFKIRSNAGLLEHSGKLIVDFDKLAKYTTIEAAWEQLINDKYSEYVLLSCTGRGLMVAVNIDPTKHLESFLYLEKYYKDCYGLILDESCKDVSRPRYISHDPNMFHNENCERVSLEPERSSATTTVDTDPEKYEWVRACHDKKHSYSEGGRHGYLVILAFFLNKVGCDYYYALNNLISDFSGNGMSEKEITQIATHCYKSESDFGTFRINKKLADLPPEFAKGTKQIYKMAHGMNEQGNMWDEETIHGQAKEHSISMDIVRSIFKNVFDKNKDSFDLENKSDLYKIELFINKRYEILKNEVSQRFEYRKRGTNDRLDKLNVDTIFRDIQHAKKLKFTHAKLTSLLRSDFVPIYNPLFNYFESLPEYGEDGVDYITELAKHVKTTNDPFWHIQFKKALVRCIACSIGYRENRIIITLIGEVQETGKSNFIRFLCPPALKEYYTETAMDGSKDSDMQLSENFIWNLEELAALYNNEINKLKAIISKANVKQRGAYREFAESNPRRVNFWASTNKAEFLTDDQNTRWLCFQVIGIDHNYNNFKTGVKKINIDNIWAQAYSLYKAGFDFNLTAAEATERDLINKGHELSSMEKDLIVEHYRPGNANVGKFMNATQILIELQKFTDNKLKLNVHAIGKALKQLEFPHTVKKQGGKTVRGYYVATIDTILNQNNIEYNDPNEPKPF